MISANKRILYGSVYNDVRCLSTDEKPTDVLNGSVLTEIDTGKTYLFDAAGKAWHEMPTGGGGGGSTTPVDPHSAIPVGTVHTITGMGD